MKVTTKVSFRKYADYLLNVQIESCRFSWHNTDSIPIACVHNNMIIAMCLIYPYGRNKHLLYNLYTLSEYRGLGAARSILDFVKKNYKNVYFTAKLKNNADTLRFYKKYGVKSILDTDDKRFYILS